MFKPLISICIPTYKKPQFVVRCLESISKQDYKQVEVVISDDSPDEDIKEAIQPFVGDLIIRYYHHEVALRSPRNWNFALDQASGDFVMLMHQDDWFDSPTAISTYLERFEKENCDFAFCQNTAIDEHGRKVILQAIPSLLKEMNDKPDHLLLAQVIGPPSNTMLKKSIPIRYDENYIWLVDVDYYNRLLKAGYKYSYIEQHLVSIGIHEDQTTVFCRTNPHIIVRENLLFAGKLQEASFRDIKIYDYYWRLFRNYGVRERSQLDKWHIDFESMPKVLKDMFIRQRGLSMKLLRIGPISKFLMLLSYRKWLTGGGN